MIQVKNGYHTYKNGYHTMHFEKLTKIIIEKYETKKP